MTLEELAIHYQETGEYLPEASVFECEFIYENMQGFYDEYIRDVEVRNAPFSIFVMMKVSNWQADNGFALDCDVNNIAEVIEQMAEDGLYDPTDDDGGGFDSGFN